MTSTMLITMPIATVTADITVQRTSFVTIELTQTILPALLPSSVLLGSSISSAWDSPSDPSTSMIILSSLSSSSPVWISPSRQTSPTPFFPLDPLATSSNAIIAAAGPFHNKQLQRHQKDAVIGGICGAIGSLFILGLIMCAMLLFWQRRRKRDDPELGVSEKSSRARIISWWMKKFRGTISARLERRGDTKIPSVSVDEHHHIIRMSTQHWPRPYARGQGYRESLPPGTLHVTNPDKSLPPTPRDSSDFNGTSSFRSFLRRPKPAFTAGGPLNSARSRASSRETHHPYTLRQHVHPLAQEVPSITVDPSFSRECMPSDNAADAPAQPHDEHNQHHDRVQQPFLKPLGSDIGTPAPSFSSYPSLTSLRDRIVQQHPPEDPFLILRQQRLDAHGSCPPGTSYTMPLPRCTSPSLPPSRHGRSTSDRPSSRERRSSVNSTVESAKTKMSIFVRYPFRNHLGAHWGAGARDIPCDRASRDTEGMSQSSSSASEGELGRSRSFDDPMTSRSRSRLSLTNMSQRRVSDPFDLDRESLRSGHVPPTARSALTAPPTLPPKAEGPGERPTAAIRMRVYEGT